MMIATEVSPKTYPHLNISDAFHPLSHHGNQPEKMARLARVQTYHSEVFAKFLDRMAALEVGDGSALDNGMFVYGSNMSNSNAHDQFPLPMSVVGRACGSIKGGQHVKVADETPLANMMVTLLDRVGVPAESFGDSTGAVSEI
jgi:hypothetical protein